MASKIVVVLSILLAMNPSLLCLGNDNSVLNAIDGCWRKDPNWINRREDLAKCSVGFAGKMSNNYGPGTTHYVVMDPSDDPVNPKKGTLRYGVTMVPGKKWISFARDMEIRLARTLIVGSNTAIDGRGAVVNIVNSGIMLFKVHDVIIHGLRIHNAQPQAAGQIMEPGGALRQFSQIDGDAIRLLGSSKVWIDHNTLSRSFDGLIDVTLGSNMVTISNNWFRDHDKVMLLGHADDYQDDKNMRVTVVYNRFGPNCHQRMPRVRHGYAHVANNLYLGWEIYAIGGSGNPTVTSDHNLFVAPQSGVKEVISKIKGAVAGVWHFKSVGDVLENGATFKESVEGSIQPNYSPDQAFRVESGNIVRQLTRGAGALKCMPGVPC